MKILLILASLIYFTAISTHASSTESSASLNAPAPAPKHVAGLIGFTKNNSRGVDSQAMDLQYQEGNPAVSGINIQVDSFAGSMALLAGMAGMTFVMIRRRHAA